MNIGTWNMRSLFWSGTLKGLHNELSKLDFDVVALKEMRLESGTLKCDNLTLFISGSESKETLIWLWVLCERKIFKICYRL